jgi:ABC-type lipoprotein release transport system permease subunit
VINIISAISAIGMAIGTAALIIILSVYNGFDDLIKSMMSNVEPDLLITPTTGKTFTPQGETFDWVYDQPEVKSMCCVLEEQVFVSYDGKQKLAKAKGVDWIYESESTLGDCMTKGEFKLHKGDIPMAAVGIGMAYEMGIDPAFLSPIEIYFPARTRKISMTNPAASIESIRVWPSGIFSVNADIDKDLMILPIGKMQELLEHDGDVVSAVEVRLNESISRKAFRNLKKEMSEILGPDYIVKDRYQQNESLYKMMKYEKAAIFMILIFVVIIIAFNIFGSLSMLIIEKKHDIQTLRSIGAKDRLIKNIFILEGWMISLAGLAGGLIIGIGFALAQQKLGFIKMPGHFVVQAYPVILSWSDVLLTAAGVALIGYLIALIPASKSISHQHPQDGMKN